VVTGIPKIVENVLQRRLRKNSIVLYLIIDRPHQTGIDVEIIDIAADSDPIVLICLREGVQAWTLPYLSFWRSLKCATWL